jgi:hypothetical protein
MCDPLDVRIGSPQVPHHAGEELFEFSDAGLACSYGSVVAGPLTHDCPHGPVLGEQTNEVTVPR